MREPRAPDQGSMIETIMVTSVPGILNGKGLIVGGRLRGMISAKTTTRAAVNEVSAILCVDLTVYANLEITLNVQILNLTSPMPLSKRYPINQDVSPKRRHALFYFKEWEWH